MTDTSTVLRPIVVRGHLGETPAVNPALAKELNMPGSTLFYEPDRDAGYVDYQTSENSDIDTAYFDEGDGEGGSVLEPAAADPAPPEIINDDQEAIAICLSPDVCRAPDKPTPFMSYGTADNDFNYSPDVYSNGLVVKHQQSKFSCCFGDEAGVGLGCASGTVGDVVEPVTSSQIVFVNGFPVQRHSDQCTLNSGNTVGEYCYVCATDVAQPPSASDEQDKAWYEEAWDGVTDAYDWTSEKVSEANDAVWEFDRNNGKAVTRGIALVGIAASAVEGAAGLALAGVGGAASATGVGAAPGVPAMIGGGLLVGNALDNGAASWKTLWTGEFQKTGLQEAAGGIVRAAGASPEVAQSVENVVGITQAVGGGVGAAAATMKVTGRTVAVSGAQGARSTRYVSDADLLVVNRNGVRISKTYRRPSFRKKTKEDAWNNAKQADGKVYDPGEANTVIKPSDKWEMGHKPGYEFRKHQESAQQRGITREQFIEEHNNASHYRPELPKTNASHKTEAPDNVYYGD